VDLEFSPATHLSTSRRRGAWGLSSGSNHFYSRRAHFPLPESSCSTCACRAIDWMDVLKLVKNNPATGRVPVVVLTTSMLNGTSRRPSPAGGQVSYETA